MNAIKFDVEKVKKCIDAFHDERGVYPYLIMSEKTKTELLDKVPNDLKVMEITSISFCIGKAEKKPDEKPDEKLPVWQNSKILYDNDLEFGEIYVR